TVEVSWEGVAALDQAKLRQIVRQERMNEFFLENQAFWDLRRWLMAKETLGVKAQGLNSAAKNINELVELTTIDFERKFESPTQYLMPIPIGDINKNDNLVNNPGY
ncbi:MAG: RagB/SusD family nutrient uptake outer membrane protein, partial [Bacteroides sp.]